MACINAESKGTQAWSSPEQLMGQRCSFSSDLFSFGVVLWEICTGERPKRGQMRDVRVPEEAPAEGEQWDCCQFRLELFSCAFRAIAVLTPVFLALQSRS